VAPTLLPKNRLVNPLLALTSVAPAKPPSLKLPTQQPLRRLLFL